jgi:hypothetical protein
MSEARKEGLHRGVVLATAVISAACFYYYSCLLTGTSDREAKERANYGLRILPDDVLCRVINFLPCKAIDSLRLVLKPVQVLTLAANVAPPLISPIGTGGLRRYRRYCIERDAQRKNRALEEVYFYAAVQSGGVSVGDRESGSLRAASTQPPVVCSIYQ